MLYGRVVPIDGAVDVAGKERYNGRDWKVEEYAGRRAADMLRLFNTHKVRKVVLLEGEWDFMPVGGQSDGQGSGKNLPNAGSGLLGDASEVRHISWKK